MICPLCSKEFREEGCTHTLSQISNEMERRKTLETLKELLEPWIKKLIRSEIGKQ